MEDSVQSYIRMFTITLIIILGEILTEKLSKEAIQREENKRGGGRIHSRLRYREI